MKDHNQEYLKYYSFKRINDFKKISEEENISIEKARKVYKSIAHYIGKKIGISEREAKEIHIQLLDKIAEIQYVYSFFNEDRKQGFINFENFYDWYIKQERKCYYCCIEEEKVEWLFKNIDTFRDSRRGRLRGHHLEIDKKNPNENYNEKNCVLACYFCNNDKSDIFIGDEYKKCLQEGRKNYLENLYIIKTTPT